MKKPERVRDQLVSGGIVTRIFRNSFWNISLKTIFANNLKLQIMITQYEVSTLLRQHIPQLSDKVYPSRISLQVYASMSYFSDYTKHAVEEHNFNAAKKCFVLAERLFRQGDKMVRMLIENIFVFAFTSMLPADKIERTMVRSMIPDTLYSLYIRQVTQAGS